MRILLLSCILTLLCTNSAQALLYMELYANASTRGKSVTNNSTDNQLNFLGWGRKIGFGNNTFSISYDYLDGNMNSIVTDSQVVTTFHVRETGYSFRLGLPMGFYFSFTALTDARANDSNSMLKGKGEKFSGGWCEHLLCLGVEQKTITYDRQNDENISEIRADLTMLQVSIPLPFF